MPAKFSDSLRSARGDVISSHIGASPIIRMYTGSEPAKDAAATGTLVSEMNLPATWLSASVDGVTSKSGTWEDPEANAAGTLGYFRILDSTGTTTHIQGNITATGGGGVMTVDNVVVEVGQKITVTGFSVTEGNN